MRDVGLVMDGSSDGKNAKIEVMYLLVLMSQLGSNYRIDEITLGKCFGFIMHPEGFRSEPTLDYFSIVTLLFYVQKKTRYERLKLVLEELIIRKFELKRESIIGDSEMIHLALDLLACPYISNVLQSEILKFYDVPKNHLIRIQRYSNRWFTKWDQFDFSKELDAKVSQEVY